ncbi:MAG: helix-turn-helix domain-containing protein [Acidimicrobiia bacterium]|nr:helix-turn-helix domain-containing protein [Acidimicrobiia bacterium]MCY4458284.1 helix-turn-helix transcriptional regulator [Acidimicrobiaceae bacterium]
MPHPRTGGELYLEGRRMDADYDLAYKTSRRRIEQIDAIIRTLEQRRCSLDLSKAELARRANLRPEVIRRIFSAESPNPTLATLVALAEAMQMELSAEPQKVSPAI